MPMFCTYYTIKVDVYKRQVEYIIHKLVYSSSCHMHAGIAGCVVDKDFPLLIRDSTVGKYYV